MLQTYTSSCFSDPFFFTFPPLFLLITHPLFFHLSLPAFLFIFSSKVHVTEVKLRTWMQRVTELRSQYNWLLFFRVPKLLLLYHLLIVEHPYVEAIVHEISFLFSHDQDAWKSARKMVEVRWKEGMEEKSRMAWISRLVIFILIARIGTICFLPEIP